MEVDDTQAYSSPHSVYCQKAGAAWAAGHHDISYSSGEKISCRTYFGNTNTHRLIQLQSTAGNYDTSKIVGSLHYRNTGDIYAFDGAVFTDTGFNYVEDVWKLSEWSFNFGANTWDAWYDGNLIVDDWDYRAGAVASIESVQLACYSATMWVDNIQFGESGELFAISPSKHGSMAGGVPI